MRVLFANKVRSLLTVTGLIIGVGAVIAIQVLGSGMSGAVNGVLSGFSDRSFIIQPNPQQGNFRRAAIHLRDLAEIQRNVPNIEAAVPLTASRQLVRAGYYHSSGRIFSTSRQGFETATFQYGGNFTAEQVASSAPLCILDDKIYERLFPHGGDPTGQSIHVAFHRYVIVGVLSPPRSGILNANFTGDVNLPWTTYDRDFLHGGVVFAGSFYVTDVAQLAETEIEAVKYLRQLHHNAKDVLYISFDRKQFSTQIDTIFGVLTLIVALIGAVSLLVAGIGIMNIMLVSVTERTREIGIRKAIGARQGQVLLQFFIEALVLCGIGCAIGLVLGLGIGYAVDTLAIVKLSGTVPPMPWLRAVLIATSFAVVVTLAFGTYPAYRAARLDPIEALRYE